MNKEVIVIPHMDRGEERLLVAVYARVSTKAERQSDSLENQIAHYRESIGADPRYELVEIYHDFGISGYKSARPGFQRMMRDAETGRFEFIITKSITRFARNTRTVLESTRHLKELGIGVFFELQKINTLSQAGELLMTLYAAFGQEESEGARKHTLMTLQRKYAEGNLPRQLQRSMGYSKGPDGEFYPDEYAPLVVEIFEMAADGYSAAEITNYLNAQGIKNHNGCVFHRGSVTRMLRNPAYKGDFIARQYFVDEDRHLVKNQGQKLKLYIEDDHIPIVTTALWDKAQETLNAATHKVVPTNVRPLPLTDENYPYRGFLFCAECGYRLSRAIRAGRVLWECSGKARFSKTFCSGVSVTDDEVREWLPLGVPVYVRPVIEHGRMIGHTFIQEEEWSQTHQKRKRDTDVPDLNENNYPYMNRIFCKYCGSRLRRIINNSGSVTWICNGLSRKGKTFCKGIRVPDEKLKPLTALEGNFYIGKEKVRGKESYGYTRKPDVLR